MGTKGSANRQRIVDAADRLFYSRGYNQTSFSDISDETGIPRGNFYYYFKTKEDILSAVVESRVGDFSQMLEHCTQSASDPRERLLALVNVPIKNEREVLQYGCPIGSLSTELVKEQDHDVSSAKLTAVFDLVRDWCIEQFTALGFEQQAGDHALDLLARMQGITLIANVYHDSGFLHRATRDLENWVKQVTGH
jgi:AcrR family transcriptional regulator